MDNIGLIGLTGGIGCGKSAALNAFHSLNCDILDADRICHDLYNEPNGVLFDAIKRRWGGKVIKSNVVDKQKIADIRLKYNQDIIDAAQDLIDREADIARKHGDKLLDLEDERNKKRLEAEEK